MNDETRLLFPTADRSWMERAACLDMDGEAFFPEGKFVPNSNEYRQHVAVVKAVCALCPCRVRCRNYADTLNITEGVWGGETGPERRKRRTEQRRTARLAS